MEEGKSSLTSFEKEWPLLKIAMKLFINLIEDGGVVIDSTSFTIQDYMSIYTYPSFLVYEQVNNKVMDAILAMIDEDRAGKQIDRKLVNNILVLYLEISDKTGKNDAKYFAEKIIKENATLSSDDEVSNWMAALSLIDNTPKEEKLKSSKKIKVMSYDGDVFEVDYDVALMSKTLQDVIKSYPNIEDSIPLYIKSCSSKILDKIIEYCKKHKDKEEYHTMEDWDAKFIDLDHKTLVDLILSSIYLNIESLGDLACVKILHMNKGKTAHELSHTFGAYIYEQRQNST